MTVRDEYDKLRKKYNLPSFDDLDDEFELGEIEDERHVLRNVRHRIQDRMEFAIGVLDNICNPDPNNMRSMQECAFFSDADKRQAYAVTQKLMGLWRSLTEAELLADEKTEAEVIKLISKDWRELKQQILPFVRKMKQSWNVSQTAKEELGYLG